VGRGVCIRPYLIGAKLRLFFGLGAIGAPPGGFAITEHLNARTSLVEGKKSVSSGTALLITDMISDYEYVDGEAVFGSALPAAENIAGLRKRAGDAGVPVIFVNDNFGAWRNDFASTVEMAKASHRGSQIVERLPPLPDDYHVLKPQRSGFFATPLDLLLAALGVKRVIITGVTTDMCVLFTAHDAYMRGFNIVVPHDCCGAVRPEHHEQTVELLARIIKADVRAATEIDVNA
jgi:nicotinamidase-related amidase